MNQYAPDLFSQSSYFNTIPIEDKKELAVKEKKAKGQEEKIFSFFCESPHAMFTPSQVWISFGQCWPLTSVRARISNLTKRGMLRMTGDKRKGFYGELENCWQFVSPLKWKGESITKH